MAKRTRKRKPIEGFNKFTEEPGPAPIEFSEKPTKFDDVPTAVPTSEPASEAAGGHVPTVPTSVPTPAIPKSAVFAFDADRDCILVGGGPSAVGFEPPDGIFCLGINHHAYSRSTRLDAIIALDGPQVAINRSSDQARQDFRPNGRTFQSPVDHVFHPRLLADAKLTKYMHPSFGSYQYSKHAESWRALSIEDNPKAATYFEGAYINSSIEQDGAVGPNADTGYINCTMFGAFRLLFGLGYRRAYLVGVDFTGEDRKPYWDKANSYLNTLRPVFDARGMEVINTNPGSLCMAFDFGELPK